MNIIQKKSPNQNGRGTWKPDVIVNHITAGTKASSAYNTFQNAASGVSAHFIVDTDGTVYQCVPLERAAWANGTGTAAGDSRYYGHSSLDVVRRRQVNANLYTVSIEHVNPGGGALTKAQLAAGIALHKHIIAEVKRIYGVTIPVDRAHIVGHCEICPRWKPNCPGKDFPYDAILAGVRGSAEVTSDTTSEVSIRRGAFYTAKFSGADEITVTAGTGGVVTVVPMKRGADTLAAIVPIGKPGDAAGIYTTVPGGQPVKQFVARVV